MNHPRTLNLYGIILKSANFQNYVGKPITIKLAIIFRKLVSQYQIPYDYTVEVRNRFEGLDLIDRVPDELWNEVRDIVQDTGIKTIPMEKKCKKAKWLSGEALQIAVKRREEKRKAKEKRKDINI